MKSILASIFAGVAVAVIAVFGARYIFGLEISSSTAAISGAVAGVVTLTRMQRSEKSDG